MNAPNGRPTIPFNRIHLTGREMRYLQACVRSGSIAGDGAYTKRCESLMEQRFGAARVILTNSCTDALEMASLLLGLSPGDEVIVPSYTFVSTVNAFVLRGAIPVFVDIREDTLNIDEAGIEKKITPRTKAIFPVHYAGVGCEMDAILSIAQRHNLRVVEDAAQGVNARYRGRHLGTLGVLGTYSFHATKNYTSGEGGALVINDRSFIDRAEILREKGTNRKSFLLGLVDKYTWVDIGSSFLLSDMLAAFLLAQLEAMDQIRNLRKKRYGTYWEGLKHLENTGRLRLPFIPSHCDSNFHFFHILLPTEERRNHLLHTLGEHGVQAVFHYLPLHASPMGSRFGYREGDLPVTEKASRCLLRLPLYPSLTLAEQRKVIKLVSTCL